MGYVLGIDLGTSSLKGIVMDKSGHVVLEKSSDYGLDTPKKGYSEQRPEVWIDACQTVLKELSNEIADFGSKLEGISFSGQMHSLVALGSDNLPVYPAILWNDVRTSKQCEQIMEEFGDDILSITKNIALEGFTLPKILWLQEHEPEVWASVRKIMLPKDYLGLWFTGNSHCEYSDAAGTLLLDVAKKKWSEEILNKFNISKEILPELVGSLAKIGTVRQEIMDKFGFTGNVSIFAGGADNACAALGAGLVNEEIGLVSIGTSGVFSAYESQIKDYDGKLHFFNHVLDSANYSMGVTLAAGNSLNWFKNTFGKGLSFQELLQEVKEVAPGSDGLLFTPYIVGERTPHVDSKIRGSFIGIDTHHELKHFSRAVLEGITFSLKDTQKIMEKIKGKKFTRLVSVGGGAKNVDWLQMQADIFNAEIVCLTVEQGPGAGACMIAALGCKWFDTAKEASETFVHYKEKTFLPKEAHVQKYQQIYTIWSQIYEATKQLSHALIDSNA